MNGKLSDLEGMNVFSLIDLKSGFHQIEIEMNSRKYTAFSLLGRKYENYRMPFGLRNKPFVFKRAISNIFRDFNDFKIFIDDILIYAKDIDSHVHNLKIIMRKLFENNVVLNFDKSEFIKTDITFLGQIISSEGIKPEISRIKEFE
ncbi:Retrovirus-related Pol polyprotein from transposon 17.6 [Dictyocoela muelleri]|nr:Retrovirus-related Pol polyprotein from transposon 17.6 [Dictyocoela muelleri]